MIAPQWSSAVSKIERGGRLHSCDLAAFLSLIMHYSILPREHRSSRYLLLGLSVVVVRGMVWVVARSPTVCRYGLNVNVELMESITAPTPLMNGVPRIRSNACLVPLMMWMGMRRLVRQSVESHSTTSTGVLSLPAVEDRSPALVYMVVVLDVVYCRPN